MLRIDNLSKRYGDYSVFQGLTYTFGPGCYALCEEDNTGKSSLLNIIAGVIGVVVGIYAFSNPESAAIIVTYVIAVWVIILGVLLVVWGVQLRERFEEYWLLIVLGVLSVLFGLLVFNNFLAGLITLASLFVAYMVVGGVLAIALAFRIKALGERLGILTA